MTEETDWPRYLLGACSSGDPLRDAVVRNHTQVRRLRAMLDLPANLRYVQARGDDHADLSDALGVEQGSLSWDQLLQLVRELRSARDRAHEVRDTEHPMGPRRDAARYILGETS